MGAFRKISKASWNAKERFFFLSFVNVLFQCNVVSHKKIRKMFYFNGFLSSGLLYLHCL